MKQSLRFAVAAAAMGVAASASAGYFEIGTEVETFNSAYDNENFYLPYVAIGGNPIADSAFHAELKTSYRQRDASAMRDDNRYRQDITVGYSWNFGDFTFSPMYRLRQDFYSGTNRTYEHRISPNMSYRINDTFNVVLDGFVAPVQQINQGARGSDHTSDSSSFNYMDYKYEFDLRLNTNISETQQFTVSLYNEYSKTNDLKKETDGDLQEKMQEWQLRLVYSHNFGGFTLTPFARIGLSREVKTVSGKTLDENRYRYGVAGSYKLASDMTLVGEIYQQNQGLERVNELGNIYSAKDKNMMFYKVSVRYSF